MPVAPYDELTPRGRTRRIRRLVPVVLAEYDIEVARVRLVAEAFNTVFRVDAQDGRRYALRVGARWRLHTDGVADVEAAWAAALAHDTDLRPPQVVRSRRGAASVWATADGVPGARECVLFTWQEGRRLHDRLPDARLLAAAGEALAVLHEHGAGTDSATANQVLPADRVCYFRVPTILPGRHSTLFAEGLAWAQEGLDALWAERGRTAHLLHGDFHPSNLLVRHRRVVPIDFQDVCWGLEEQDLAITLASLARRDRSGAAAASFRAGYTRRRRWPDLTDDRLEVLTIARRLHVANLMLHVWPAEAPAFVDELGADLRAVLGGTS